jgi:hypothetical protein
MRLPLILAAGALAVTAPLVAADGPELTPEQATQLRCAAAFGLIASEQARGIESALEYPPLGERGKEYFVQVSAALMDAHSLSRDGVSALVNAQVEEIQKEAMMSDDPAAHMQKTMTSCFVLLEASGL